MLTRVRLHIYNNLFNTYSIQIQVPTVAADVTLLTAGITGAVVLSVYSSDLPQSGFLIPRTVDATAAIFTEPDDAIPRTSISRQSSHGNSHRHEACPRPIISLGDKINQIADKTSLLFDKVSEPIAKLEAKIGGFKMSLVDKLGIGCLVPKLIRSFEPIFQFLRCKLGLEEDEFMEAAQCNSVRCEESIEEQVITNSRPSPMIMMTLDVQTMSDCFGDMKEVRYGSRVLAKIVRDQSCDAPQYQEICQDLFSEDRVIKEENCQTSK